MEAHRSRGPAPEGSSGRGPAREEGSSRQRRDAQIHRYLRGSRSAQATAREPSFCRDFVKASKPALLGLVVMCFFLFIPLRSSPLRLFRWLQCGLIFNLLDYCISYLIFAFALGPSMRPALQAVIFVVLQLAALVQIGLADDDALARTPAQCNITVANTMNLGMSICFLIYALKLTRSTLRRTHGGQQGYGWRRMLLQFNDREGNTHAASANADGALRASQLRVHERMTSRGPLDSMPPIFGEGKAASGVSFPGSCEGNGADVRHMSFMLERSLRSMPGGGLLGSAVGGGGAGDDDGEHAATMTPYAPLPPEADEQSAKEGLLVDVAMTDVDPAILAGEEEVPEVARAPQGGAGASGFREIDAGRSPADDENGLSDMNVSCQLELAPSVTSGTTFVSGTSAGRAAALKGVCCGGVRLRMHYMIWPNFTMFSNPLLQWLTASLYMLTMYCMFRFDVWFASEFHLGAKTGYLFGDYLFFVFVIFGLKSLMKTFGYVLDSRKIGSCSYYFIGDQIGLCFYFVFYRGIFDKVARSAQNSREFWGTILALQAFHCSYEWVVYVARCTHGWHRFSRALLGRLPWRRKLRGVYAACFQADLPFETWQRFICWEFALRAIVSLVSLLGYALQFTVLRFGYNSAFYPRFAADTPATTYRLLVEYWVQALVVELLNLAAMQLLFFAPRSLSVMNPAARMAANRRFDVFATVNYGILLSNFFIPSIVLSGAVHTGNTTAAPPA